MNILEFVTCRRAAIAHVRACADAIAEQNARLACGWDSRGLRDDSRASVSEFVSTHSREAFAVAQAFTK